MKPFPFAYQKEYGLRTYTTLKAGGPAEFFTVARSCDELARAALAAAENGLKCFPLGWGSNMLLSDRGIRGLVVLNLATEIERDGDDVLLSTGLGFQDAFLKMAQMGFGGLEYAVGIPGTLGGALVSNAGAYRSNVSEFIHSLEVVYEGKRQWVEPSFMGFRYRDSILRSETPPQCTVLRVRMTLPKRDPKLIYDEARDYQRQRISKQPPMASAGSFFKNIYDQALADSLDNLPGNLRRAGVVPAGYLIEKCGLKGKRYHGAMIGARHANFLLNVAGASAGALRRLAEFACAEVERTYGVRLEEEVLYLGDWSGWVRTGVLDEA